MRSFSPAVSSRAFSTLTSGSTMSAATALALPRPDANSDHDEALSAAARSALRYSGYTALESLTCEVHGGVATISGVVSSFYLKQVAQAALLKLPMLRAVDNQVEVA